MISLNMQIEFLITFILNTLLNNPYFLIVDLKLLVCLSFLLSLLSLDLFLSIQIILNGLLIHTVLGIYFPFHLDRLFEYFVFLLRLQKWMNEEIEVHTMEWILSWTGESPVNLIMNLSLTSLAGNQTPSFLNCLQTSMIGLYSFSCIMKVSAHN